MQHFVNNRQGRRAARFLALTAAGLLVARLAPAQGLSTAGLTTATTEIKGAFTVVTNLMYAVCAIIGIVGAISVYSKWSNGDPDFRKAAGSWFGALIFAGLVVVTLTAVFG
jgi:hypothetical protein